jgi:choline dehydrogenase-like flavoprotein
VTSRYDVIVIGSGAGGSMAARELSEHGLAVLVLEAGRDVDRRDMAPRKPAGHGPHLRERIIATLTGKPIQVRVAFFNAWMARMLVPDWLHRYRTGANAPFLWFRGRQVGGRLHIFGRVLHRWSDHEFRPDPACGRDGWPIRYADLAPWYAKAETILSVEGNEDGAETAPDGLMARPLPLTEGEQAFQRKLHATNDGRRAIAWRMAPRDATPRPRALEQALATGRVTLQPDAVVTEIATDPATGRATGVVWRDRHTREPHVTQAGAVVLCASPIESIRLLLNSRSTRHPDGIGNSAGLLGRYFMDQPATLVLARFPGTGTGADPVASQPGGIYVTRQPGAPGRLGFTAQGSIGRHPHVRPGPHDDASFMCFGEMAPDPDNRVTLDPQRRDRWGVPLPVITCRLGAREATELPRQAEAITAMIAAAGGRTLGWVSPLGLQQRDEGIYRELNPLSRWIVRRMIPASFVMGAAIHESGGARMGTTAQNSVVDSFNRCWDAPNVLVTDASAFASSGVMGTTLTVMALTLRACAQLADELNSAPQGAAA